MNSILPINNGIFASGKQQLSITLSSLDEKPFFLDPATKFRIMEFDAQTTLEFKSIVKELEPNLSNNGSYDRYTVKAEFEASVPYEINSLVKALPLIELDEIERKLSDYFGYIKSLFQHKEYDKIRMEMQEKENNIATAMYLSPAESEARLNSIFDDMENGFELDGEALSFPYFFENGRIVSFRNYRGAPAIRLINRNSGEELFIELNVMVDRESRKFHIV
ncbi:MAG: hypothetical protein LBF27_29355 [Sphingobacterium sp.]|nr:hypothetical protein [Sphingobacterium sp.]